VEEGQMVEALRDGGKGAGAECAGSLHPSLEEVTNIGSRIRMMVEALCDGGKGAGAECAGSLHPSLEEVTNISIRIRIEVEEARWLKHSVMVGKEREQSVQAVFTPA